MQKIIFTLVFAVLLSACSNSGIGGSVAAGGGSNGVGIGLGTGFSF